MEQYTTLFTLLSLANLKVLFKYVFNVEPDDELNHAGIVEKLEEYVEENGGYNIPELDDAILKTLKPKLNAVFQRALVDDEGYQKYKIKFHSPESQGLYDSVMAPKQYHCTLQIGGFVKRFDYTMGGGHREKKVIRDGKKVWEFYHEHGPKRVNGTLTVHSFNEWLEEHAETARFSRTATKRATKPDALSVLDSLLSDAEAVTWCDTVEDFVNEFGYTEDYASMKRGERAYESCQQTLKDLRRMLSVSSEFSV